MHFSPDAGLTFCLCRSAHDLVPCAVSLIENDQE